MLTHYEVGWRTMPTTVMIELMVPTLISEAMEWCEWQLAEKLQCYSLAEIEARSHRVTYPGGPTTFYFDGKPIVSYGIDFAKSIGGETKVTIWGHNGREMDSASNQAPRSVKAQAGS